ncbi:ferritin-like domain-containing protein [Embleya hyalina]|uniref:Membrane protein n=1 Tax=Embleya hyalina TaxID=516124 RepID=A0A401YE54_9ACTN|nr:ferritin-like protein [Embleya hyalina]GCD92887.1 membrane protein [Embleya hyalina]
MTTTLVEPSLAERISHHVLRDNSKDMDEIRDQLQCAIDLELATIPAYLCGLWSIKDKKSATGKPAYDLIKSVVLEEMLHMGLACNMLTAIGGEPKIDPPAYPKTLPGGVGGDLVVHLQGLTKDYVKGTYLAIEAPEIPSLPPLTTGTPVTIGSFYDTLLRRLRRHSPALTRAHQLGDVGLGLFEIQDFADIERAIAEIKAQGEGTATVPGISDEPDELAHYYKFAQIVAGGQLVKKGTGRWEYSKDLPVPFPEAWPMVEVPKGGYATKYTVSADVQKKMTAFNGAYKVVLGLLRDAWTTSGDGRKSLSAAVSAMGKLESLATPLLEEADPKNPAQHFGPEFLGA